MLAKLFLVFLVGYASASHYAWKPNTEYTYRVSGRALSGLPEQNPTMSGVLIKSELKIVPRTPEVLTAKLHNSQHCRVQTQFRDDWEEEVPESKCQFRPLAISEEPFEIHLQDGIVADVVVAKTMKNWEANMIKAIVSQIQLNVNAKHPIDSETNVLPRGKDALGVFRVMEKTVTGEFETTYVMKPEGDRVWPVLAHELEDTHGQNIMVSKSKNFTTHGSLVGYHFGFGEMTRDEPNTDSMGSFMNRTSISNAVIYGDLQDYVIKSSNTSTVVSSSPLYNNHKAGIIASRISIVLKNMQPGKTYDGPSQPINVGLLYQYSNSYENNNVESARRPQHVADEENAYNRPAYQRLNAALRNGARSMGYHLDQSQLELTKPSPAMNAYLNGFEGRAIKMSDKVDIVKEVSRIAREIGQDLEQPNELPKKETISKFVILVRLTRQMDKEEMQKVSDELHTNEHSGHKVESWKAIRDAIAQAGTGPALLTVRDWIKNGKVDEHEAASLVARMAIAARHPTTKYLRAFQKLVEESVQNHWDSLNNTALISYADLLHKVCVDKEVSYQHYPFHTYGSFYTSECQTIVKEYIRYLEQRLQQAVAQSDSHDILIHTIALGRVGQRDIYRVLEKYIRQTPEKRHQIPEHQRVTEFQRFAMVNTLRRFVELYPEAARELLSSIYFSTSEPQELRSVAVYLIGNTEPDTALLTSIAQYTQVDRNEHVNSAVKSTIRKLITMDYEPAIQAERYLNEEEYGLQHSHTALRHYVRENMNTELRHYGWTFASADHFIPKGIQGKLYILLGDARFALGIYELLVSSVEETIHAFEHQTEFHREQLHKKHANNKDEQHSSHKIYEALGMDIEEREQLEGLIYIRIADGFRDFPVNNHTVDNITEIARHLQEELKNGHKFSLTKWIISHEAVLSAPTELGLPYTISAAMPTLASLDGKVQAEAHPEISNGHLLNAPETIQANAEVRALFNKEFHSSIRVYTPFDHQDYVSGYGKKLQVQIPIVAKVHADLKNNHITADLKPVHPEQDIKVLHMSTTPYNARHDLLDIRPVANTDEYVVLTQEKPHRENIEFGKNAIGMQFELHRETDQDSMSWNRLLQSIRHKGAVETAMRMVFDDEILYSKTELTYKGSQSANHEVKVQVRYGHRQSEHQQGSAPSVEEILNLPAEQQPRIQQAIEKAGAGIKSVDIMAGDIQIQFQGQQEVTVRAGAASARGPVDRHSRVVAYVQTESKESQKPWKLALIHNGESPNTNGLDYEYALQMHPKIKAHTRLAIQRNGQTSNVELNAEFHKTEERVQYLQHQPEHHRCQQEMKEGNRIMPACANMTVRANLMDEMTIRIKHDGLSQQAKLILQKIAELARPCRGNDFEFEHHNEHQNNEHQNNEIEIHARFAPCLSYVNYTLQGKLATEMKHTCNRIQVNRWQRQLAVLHPVFPAPTRLIAEAYNIDTYRPICVVDKTRASTFDGKEYDAQLSDSWTVMFHYVPQYANQTAENDLKYRKNHQIREHVVLVRREQQGKAVKITLRAPNTEQKLVEVEMRPTGQSNPRVKVLVDKQEVQYNQEQSQDFHHRAIRVYGLPNDEVKVEVNGRYYIIADGQRVKLTATSPLFNNATRGLCGNFNGLEMDDFVLPHGEVTVEDAQRFVEAYTIGHPQQRKQHHVQRERVHAEIPSFQRIQELSQRQDEDQAASCTAHRTLYFRRNEKDCFSARAYPVCKPGCHPQEETAKTIDLICLEESSATQQWRRKAQAGDYLNFQNRQPNEHIETKIQSHCQQ